MGSNHVLGTLAPDWPWEDKSFSWIENQWDPWEGCGNLDSVSEECAHACYPQEQGGSSRLQRPGTRAGFPRPPQRTLAHTEH